MAKRSSNAYIAARSRLHLKPGEVIRMLRELKGWTQAELADRSGIGASNLSLLEHGRVEIGRKRAEQLAEAFGVHPAIIMFPAYESDAIGEAA
jgi:transcriptional regulator with XRE-family HTH domain